MKAIVHRVAYLQELDRLKFPFTY